jgi:hypothetical protein
MIELQSLFGHECFFDIQNAMLVLCPANVNSHALRKENIAPTKYRIIRITTSRVIFAKIKIILIRKI